ncbi:transglutaminase domain-containing protein [Aromatoleum aromaticum]|nr:hypothetical protein [Aromatoleum aromaticum]NMG54666.1 transglutaminase domain-containing protein [Aromatoleum aromaticum]
MNLLVTIVLVGSLAPHFKDSAELVRMRNALLLQPEPAMYEWTPANVPEGFAVEPAEPIPLYADIVTRHGLRVEGDDWATALKIGQHLLVDGRRGGGAIQSDLADTYARITEQGEGYCGDFADSFTGLATTAGIFSRPWAFSFDGFGGRGHIFNEIWDSQNARWIMIDVFNNFYVTDTSGRPLSAMAFRDALMRHQSDVKFAPVKPTARRAFTHDEKALEFYRRGLPEWYMWWGNNVFEYDRAPLVRMLGETHRALEQLGGVAAGVHPRIRVLETSDNLPQRETMTELRVRLLAIVVLSLVTLICLCAWLLMRRRHASGIPA